MAWPVGPHLHLDQVDSWGRQSAPDDAKGRRVEQVQYRGRNSIRLQTFAEDYVGKDRAQLVGPSVFEPGQTWRAVVGLTIPVALEKLLPGSWAEYLQLAYGPPYTGSPAWRIMTSDGVNFGLRHGDERYTVQAPIRFDSRYRFEFEWLHTTDPARGWLQLKTLLDGLPCPSLTTAGRVAGATILPSHASTAEPNAMRLDAYVNEVPSAVAIFDSVDLVRLA